MVKLGEKKTAGRRKIEMKKIENKNSRQVTFSKRRSGLFKKASDFSILTGSQIAVFVLSSTQKVYTFGHPNADAVVEKYLAGRGFVPVIQAPDGSGFFTVRQTPARQTPVLDFGRLNAEYLEIRENIAAEKKRCEEIERNTKSRGGCTNRESEEVLWWTKAVNEMNSLELENFMISLQELKKNLEKKAEEKAMIENYYMNYMNQAESKVNYCYGDGYLFS